MKDFDAWAVVDKKGVALSDHRGRILYTTKERAEEVAELWKASEVIQVRVVKK